MTHKRDKAHNNKVTQVFHSLSLSRAAFRRKMAHEIISLLRKSHKYQNVSFVAIVGIGGLGNHIKITFFLAFAISYILFFVFASDIYNAENLELL